MSNYIFTNFQKSYNTGEPHVTLVPTNRKKSCIMMQRYCYHGNNRVAGSKKYRGVNQLGECQLLRKYSPPRIWLSELATELTMTSLTNHTFRNVRLNLRITREHTFNFQAPCVLCKGQAFRYSPENAFYIFNPQIYFVI